MLDDGVLRTGDIGYMDPQGYVFIEDRKKDMVLVSGFNVYPNEVEGVVVTHPGVLEVAAVAQPDERPRGRGVVRGEEGSVAHEDDVIEHCRKSLTATRCRSASISATSFRSQTSQDPAARPARRAAEIGDIHLL